MYASVRAFLEQIIDYAGLFPPAQLRLDEAVRRFLQERTASPHYRMLRGFVCPTARLQELFAVTKSNGRPFAVVALGQQSAQASDFLPQVEADVRIIQQYRRAWQPVESQAGISTYEAALPKGAACQWSMPLLESMARVLQQANLTGFFEIPPGDSWHDDVTQVCQLLGAWQRKMQNFGRVGLKLRCGGLTAHAFPSSEQVAHFIAKCGEGAVRWKATAGLHHPRPHWDQALKVWHHGFLNVFAAGVLAGTQLSSPDLAEILADRQLTNLRFKPDSMEWKSWKCSTAEIAEARANFATSFGSCSFEEPCEDLIAMGLLGRVVVW